jgi:hypothetical protein
VTKWSHVKIGQTRGDATEVESSRGGVSIAALGLANALVSKPTSGSALALKPPATWGNA